MVSDVEEERSQESRREYLVRGRGFPALPLSGWWLIRTPRSVRASFPPSQHSGAGYRIPDYLRLDISESSLLDILQKNMVGNGSLGASRYIVHGSYDKRHRSQCTASESPCV